MPILYIKDENGNFVEIPALKGSPGKTPVRGVDYWTEADKEQIVDEVLGQVEAPDMDDYYTKTETDAKIQAAVGSGGGSTGGGSSSNEGVYELIETYTPTEEIAFERTAEPDGTPYNFKAVLLKVSGRPSAKTYIVANLMHGYAYLGSMALNISADGATHSAFECWQKYGYWTSENYPGSTSNETYAATSKGGNYYTVAHSIEKYPAIKRISMRSGASVPVGMTMEIWGVRA